MFSGRHSLRICLCAPKYAVKLMERKDVYLMIWKPSMMINASNDCPIDAIAKWRSINNNNKIIIEPFSNQMPRNYIIYQWLLAGIARKSKHFRKRIEMTLCIYIHKYICIYIHICRKMNIIERTTFSVLFTNEYNKRLTLNIIRDISKTSCFLLIIIINSISIK